MGKNKSIAIVSGKGGTGKSLISASIASWLASAGFKTLLVDMDLYTCGLTYYLTSDKPIKIDSNLRDYFNLDENSKSTIEPLNITSNEAGKLYFLPSISKKGRKIAEIYSEFNLKSIYSDLVKLIDIMTMNYSFDYIIFDSRGGSDLTSVASAMAAQAYIIVTEADKTSWDAGNLLIETIDKCMLNYEIDVQRLGFIINKNVLPSEAIEYFLKNLWDCPHLTTIDNEINVVKWFQQGKIPIQEDKNSKFNYSIIKIIKKLYLNDKWTDEQIEFFFSEEYYVQKYAMQSSTLLRKIRMKKQLTLIIGLYTSLILISLIIYIINTKTNFFNRLIHAELPMLTTFSLITCIVLLIVTLVVTIELSLRK